MSYVFTHITEDLAQKIFEETQSARLLIDNVLVYKDADFIDYILKNNFGIVIDEDRNNYLSDVSFGLKDAFMDMHLYKHFYFFYNNKCYFFYTQDTFLTLENDIFFFRLTPPPDDSQEYKLFITVLANMMVKLQSILGNISPLFNNNDCRSAKFVVNIDSEYYNLFDPIYMF